MRQSGLARPKWNRRDYLAQTVANALKGRTEFYSAGRKADTLRIACGYLALSQFVRTENKAQYARIGTRAPKCKQSARYGQPIHGIVRMRLEQPGGRIFTLPDCGDLQEAKLPRLRGLLEAASLPPVRLLHFQP